MASRNRHLQYYRACDGVRRINVLDLQKKSGRPCAARRGIDKVSPANSVRGGQQRCCRPVAGRSNAAEAAATAMRQKRSAAVVVPSIELTRRPPGDRATSLCNGGNRLLPLAPRRIVAICLLETSQRANSRAVFDCLPPGTVSPTSGGKFRIWTCVCCELNCGKPNHRFLARHSAKP